jgi:hypothetical protein
MTHLRTLAKGLPEAAALLLLISALQACSACATVGVQRQGFTALDTAEKVLEGTQELESGLVCGRPSAPPAPLCVTIEQHHELQGYLLQASGWGHEAEGVLRSMPKRGDPPERAVELIAKIYALLQRVLSALPHSQQGDALQAQLVGSN